MGSVWTIVVAAGSGSRFGRPKQYQPLGDRRVLDWALRASRLASDGVVLVVPGEQADDAEPGADQVVPGHASRSGSVRAGLDAVPLDAEIVVVHDGARPLATSDLFASVIATVRDGAAAAVPAVPVTDTVRSRGGGVVDRGDLVAVQTPQAFRATDLRAAHAGGNQATDDASLVEAGGGVVALVPGAATNLKITYPTDLLVAEALLPGVLAEHSPALRRRDRQAEAR
ncbi:MAG: IspD/TarI family cytidylyltransferase [Acidimicrobiales bacterium]